MLFDNVLSSKATKPEMTEWQKFSFFMNIGKFVIKFPVEVMWCIMMTRI